YWIDEHEFDHVGVIARDRGAVEYLDYGSGARSPATVTGPVAWDRFRVRDPEVVVAEQQRSRPVFVLVGAAVAVLLMIVGIAWAVWPSSDDQTQASNGEEPGQAQP